MSLLKKGYDSKYVRKFIKYLETDKSVRSYYLLINHQLKLVVNKTKKHINRFNGLLIS